MTFSGCQLNEPQRVVLYQFYYYSVCHCSINFLNTQLPKYKYSKNTGSSPNPNKNLIYPSTNSNYHLKVLILVKSFFRHKPAIIVITNFFGSLFCCLFVFYNMILYCFFGNFTSYSLAHLPVWPYPSHPCSVPTKEPL